MTIYTVWEHNKGDTLLYSVDFAGAYTRGKTLDEAISKMPSEISSYLNWIGEPAPTNFKIELVSEKISELDIKDADSDVILESERSPLTIEKYERLKELALKSAKDFLALYESIPDKGASASSIRKTFYGQAPRTAQEMYEHTKNVNEYYFAEIGIDADNTGDIYTCRARGLETLEKSSDFLKNAVTIGSYEEEWSLCKVLRRFIWHDRIHAKAMWRMANRVFGERVVSNPFHFFEGASNANSI